MKTIICKEVRKVEGGFVVEVRWPFGGDSSGFGEVVCVNWGEVLRLLTKAAPEEWVKTLISYGGVHEDVERFYKDEPEEE